MVKMTTYVETLVDVRLSTTENVAPISVKLTNPRSLMRTTSFDRIRQFPTYFCHQSSNEIHQWISSSKKNLSKLIADLSQQLHHILLTICVYSVVGMLLLQFASCLVYIFTNHLPSGLGFLLLCVLVMTVLAAQIMPYKPKEVVHKGRSRTRKTKHD
ncbi:uncharacterized protein LOC106672951 isoform X2 [Cimex lectularius]|uniref:Uncharacterized protein n=1 Tax=Cimex lectularius TaxID=79782 RepID=A0A8I6SFP1_CIMLE|nr:uncharacterized protein LOC106672951 isoform X2 [Cimex lectularius]